MRKPTLGLTGAQVGLGATFYLVGQVVGALLFGFATDRLGRKKLFYWTLIKEADDERQIAKIIAIAHSDPGYHPEKETLLSWEKFHSNHRYLPKNLLDRALGQARAWST